jgi:two-component system, chemotaxis family, protein-glutamate methylesterase/glutaminase
MNQVARVLVVDDSAYVRKVITEMLAQSPLLEVVGTARDGREALDKVQELKPDVVTCDLIMPDMNGVEFIRRQMKKGPVPILVVSIASEAGEMALSAMEAGAVDFVQKPTALATDKIFEITEELIQKVKTAAQARLGRLPAISTPAARPLNAFIQRQRRVDAVVLGISTGGPQALRYLIPQFAADFAAPIIIVMHMPVGYTDMYAQKLNELSSLTVSEAKEGDVLRPGAALFAPAGRHMTFHHDDDGIIVTHLDARPFNTLHRPSVDVMFQSAAEIYGERLLGVVMTGMGSDGQQGAAWIKAKGGLVYTESEETCVVYGMPACVSQAGLSDRSVALTEMAAAIQEII